MQVEEELANYTPQRESIITIGVFDGVHLGHRHLVDYLNRQALIRDYASGVVTFAKHPQQVLSPHSSLYYITRLSERIELLKQAGVDFVVPLSFTLELANLSARDFVTMLQKHLKMRGLVVGPDFALGKGREGDVFFLHELGKELGFTVEVVSPMILDEESVRSTAIRQALVVGDIEKVGKFLGRPFSMKGRVGHGVERGRGLGFPTANLEVRPDQALPKDGVYVTRAYLDGQPHLSVTNIGMRPTFDEMVRTIEVFLLDFKGDVYGEELRIELLERLRDEKRFSDPAELKAQIEKDVEVARGILQRVNA